MKDRFEEKARELVKVIRETPTLLQLEFAEYQIAAAFRDVERETLEKAAALCEKGSDYIPPCCLYEVQENARVILALLPPNDTGSGK